MLKTREIAVSQTEQKKTCEKIAGALLARVLWVL